MRIRAHLVREGHEGSRHVSADFNRLEACCAHSSAWQSAVTRFQVVAKPAETHCPLAGAHEAGDVQQAEQRTVAETGLIALAGHEISDQCPEQFPGHHQSKALVASTASTEGSQGRRAPQERPRVIRGFAVG